MCDEPWWKPDALISVRGAADSWTQGPYTLDSLLMVGEDGDPGLIVYLSVTSEKRS